ncbi:hypothetical protein ACLOJK_035106, partial [Asimina triloba]
PWQPTLSIVQSRRRNANQHRLQARPRSEILAARSTANHEGAWPNRAGDAAITQIEHDLGSSTFNLLRQIWAATPRAAPWLSLCTPISFRANPKTHSSPTSTSTRRSMATKPILTQQRATHLTNSKVTPPAPFIGINFNLDPESVGHPAASTFRSSNAGTIRSSMDDHHKKTPSSHRDPSRSRSPCPPAAVQAATKNPTSNPWQPEKKPKISSHFMIRPRATNLDHTGQSSVAHPLAKWVMAARRQERETHHAQISMDSEVGQRSSAIHRAMTSMENQAAPIIVD